LAWKTVGLTASIVDKSGHSDSKEESHIRIFIKSAKTERVICIKVRAAVDVPDKGGGAAALASTKNWASRRVRIVR
jgi:hypothetical protein